MAKKDVRKIGKKMDKSEARKWVKNYKKKYPEDKYPDVKYGWLFGSDILETMEKYDGCEGLWFFKGLNDEGEEKLVIFPADADGNILDNKMKSVGAAAKLNGGDFDPANASDPCPPDCPDGL